ncbi:TetR/AcrR family transcriptional regulator [Xanthobacter sp. KR7-225]|uniref:TetR/AcrR family transcriptional regulator n=1 Tax=Xanthobacter sp. KR7-225 TaxID=3156613 RepID=UPI0032B38CE0
MAAAAVFSDKGYRASTIQDIGRELGTTSAALYYYFGSKQEILGELIVRPVRQLREMAADVARSPLSNRAKLGEIVRRHIAMMLKQRELFTIFLRERVELEPQHAARLAEMEEEYYHQIRGIIEDAARAGEMRPVNRQMLALGIIGMTNWVLRWHKPDGALGADEIASAYMDILSGGAFRGPPEADAAPAAPPPDEAAPRRRVKRAS